MNLEIKKEWVEALRSGKYRQTKGTLRYNDKFCCLGVLCDLLIDRTGLAWSYGEQDPEIDLIYNINNEEGQLPEPVVKLAELEDSNPGFPIQIQVGISEVGITLSELNDLALNPLSFPQIADVIDYFF